MSEDRKEYHQKYFQKNKEKIREKHGKRVREYQIENAEYFKEKRRAHLKRNIPQRIFEYAANRARRRGLDFNITLEDVLEVWTDTCPVFKEELTDTYGSGKSVRSPYNYSLDRIDSSKGYIKGNLQILSYKANLMKSDATPKELVAFAKGILELFDKSGEYTQPVRDWIENDR